LKNAVSRTTEMSSPPSSESPYERGVAHLKRSEYVAAISAFTEAIRRDPDAPNAYVGRALAHRSLGEAANAVRDEQAAQALGGAERTTWDRLVNRAFRRWNENFDDPRWCQSDPLSRKAVLLNRLNEQIFNGGLLQWIANGYGAWVDDVIEAAEEVGTDAAREVAATLKEVSRILKARPEARWEALGEFMAAPVVDGQVGREDLEAHQEFLEAVYSCEDRYYGAQSQFVIDVEEWVEREAPHHEASAPVERAKESQHRWKRPWWRFWG
jgi:tetratricopeptide (TPR) repeat protein